LDKLAGVFHCTTDNNFELTEREMHAIVIELGATKVEIGRNFARLFPG